MDAEERLEDGWSYELIEYNQDSMHLQFYFENPAQMSQSLTDLWSIEVTFWGTQYFKSIYDVEVPIGTTLRQPILRLIKDD